jgi:hypothetical protein
MPDYLFTKYLGSPLVILSISCGDWGDNGSYRDVDTYVFKELALEDRAEKGNEIRGKGCKVLGSRLLSP